MKTTKTIAFAVLAGATLASGAAQAATWSDSFLGYRYGTGFREPSNTKEVRKHVLQRRGILAHDAQRTPARGLSATARAEVDHLLERLARHDPRAAL